MAGSGGRPVRELRERVDALEEANRKAARQAAPFRRPDSNKVPDGE